MTGLQPMFDDCLDVLLLPALINSSVKLSEYAAGITSNMATGVARVTYHQPQYNARFTPDKIVTAHSKQCLIVTVCASKDLLSS